MPLFRMSLRLGRESMSRRGKLSDKDAKANSAFLCVFVPWWCVIVRTAWRSVLAAVQIFTTVVMLLSAFVLHRKFSGRALSALCIVLTLTACRAAPSTPVTTDAPAPPQHMPLLLPQPSTTPPTAVPSAADTPAPSPTDTAIPSRAESSLGDAYCIWPGETLSAIAADAGVTPEEILTVNPDFNGQAGSTIHLPPDSTPPSQWASAAHTVDAITDLPSGISGIYLGADNRTKRVALSFDVGYDPADKAMMELLARRGIHATFFVLGAAIERHPDVIANILNNRHELGNHSFTHNNMQRMGVRAIRAELQKTEDAVQAAYPGATTKPYLRAPFGAINTTVRRVAQDEGYHLIAWTVDSHDWQEGVTGDEIYERVTRLVCPGAIIAMHDDNPANRAALPRLLDFLEQNGYAFVPVSEILLPK